MSNRFKQRNERGQALIIAIIVFTLLLTLTVVSTVATLGAISATSTTAATSSAVLVSQTALSSVIANVEQTPSWVCPHGTCSLSNPNVKPSGYTPASGWAMLGSHGQMQQCSNPLTSNATPCFHVNINYAAGQKTGNCSAYSGTTTVVCPASARILITVVSRCLGTAHKCNVTAYQAILIRRSYLDYLEFINQQSLSPAGASWLISTEKAESATSSFYPFNPTCNSTKLNKTVKCVPSLTGSDKINGPIHSNAPYWYYCSTGSPKTVPVVVSHSPAWAVESTGTPVTKSAANGGGQWKPVNTSGLQGATASTLASCDGVTPPTDSGVQAAAISPPNFSVIKTDLSKLAMASSIATGCPATTNGPAVNCYSFPAASAVYIIIGAGTKIQIYSTSAAIGGITTYTSGQPSSATAAGTKAQVAGAAGAEAASQQAYPADGVVYSGGNVYMVCEAQTVGATSGCSNSSKTPGVMGGGPAPRGLTIAAAGNIYVPAGNSLVYSCDKSQLSASPPVYSSSVSNCANSNSELGLIAGGDVVIGSPNPGDGTVVMPGITTLKSKAGVVGSSMQAVGTNGQMLEAAMYATGSSPTACKKLGNTIASCGAVWSPLTVYPCPNTGCPYLYLYGAVAGNYYPVFGTYILQTTSQLLKYGFRKTFGYDTRMQTKQPPFFIQPAATQWEQQSLTSAPISLACPRLFKSNFSLNYSCTSTNATA